MQPRKHLQLRIYWSEYLIPLPYWANFYEGLLMVNKSKLYGSVTSLVPSLDVDVIYFLK